MDYSVGYIGEKFMDDIINCLELTDINIKRKGDTDVLLLFHIVNPFVCNKREYGLFS